ncbi:alpha N-terminal protein methyltransferase 1 [Clonorchis sinensis]|uniref:Alpha N-terminal protein methyltransferase 1 n=1 Tax=Clonorchis sinensis TaxID=79923 RepID=G7Y6D3_CLOSI|nr:alpha N-terminal protein methyltransferase 1 [Clonorchis sinensis]
MSSVNSTDLPAVAAVHKEGRQFLWQKTAFALNYVWTHFGEDFDFFYKADDDTYALIDNMRLLLANHDPSIPAIIGKVHQYVVKQGYADGGAGYVMSRAALRLFVHGMKNTSMCYNETHSEFEDMKVGACAEALGIPAIPAVDGKGYLKFFTKSPLDYLRTGGIKASLSFVNHRQVVRDQRDHLSACGNFQYADVRFVAFDIGVMSDDCFHARRGCFCWTGAGGCQCCIFRGYGILAAVPDVEVNSYGVLLFNVQRYLKAAGSCTLRKDKALPEHDADCRITCTDPVHWVAFNSDGLVLAVVTSNEAQGTFVHLVSLVELLRVGSTQLSSISRSVRVCGGEPSTATGQPGWEIRDFAWSPASPDTFVLILKSGVVRIISASPDRSSELVTVVGHLQCGVDAQCLSWSGKGKQLAICLNGILPTANGTVQGPLILQVDPQLRLKRTVALDSVLPQFSDAGTTPRPLDLLWISPSSFILGLQCGSSLRAVLVSAPTKSTVVTHTELVELRGITTSSHRQYYFRAVGSHYFLATHSAGEEVLLYHLPAQSSTVVSGEEPPPPPTSLLNIELPPEGFPVGLSLGFHCENSQSGQLQPYAIARLTNGNSSPFLLHMPTILESLQPSLPKPIDLPAPPPPVCAPVNLCVSKPYSSDGMLLRNTASPLSVPTATTPLLAPTTNGLFLGLIPQTGQHPSTSKAPTQTPSEDISTHTSQSVTTPFANGTRAPYSERHPQVADANVLARTHSSHLKSSSQDRVASLPHSVQIAATQFTTALLAEAEAGRAAWRELFDLMKRGPHMESKQEASTGVDVIEARVYNVNVFMKAIDEVLNEVHTKAKDRRQEFLDSQIYAEQVRKAFCLCASEAFIPTLTSRLDPEASRLLERLKRRSHLVETGLFDLEAQLDALSAEIENRVGAKRSVAKISTQVGSAEDSSLSHKKVLETLGITERLICAERGRVEYLMESLQRLRLTTALDGSGVLSPLACSGTPSSSGKHRGSHSKLSRGIDESIPSPAYQSLLQRDRALYRLFSHHTLSVVDAPIALPTIDADTEDDQLISESAEPALPSSPVVQGRATHFQQRKLEQLVGFSGEAASTNSPPPRDPDLLTQKHSDPIVFSANVRPCVTTPTPPLPRIHLVSPPQTEFSSSTKLVSASPTVHQTPAFSSASVNNSHVTEVPPTSSQSPSAGLFVLGQKSTLATSPVIVVQKSGSPGTTQRIHSPASTVVSPTMSNAATATTSSMGIFGRPLVSSGPVSTGSLQSATSTSASLVSTAKSVFSFGSFGQTVATTVVPTANTISGIFTSPFGGLFNSSAAQPAKTTSVPQSPSLFGAPAFSSGASNLFGSLSTATVPSTTSGLAQPTTTQVSGGGLFGSALSSQPFGGGGSGLFGSLLSTAVTTKPSTLVTLSSTTTSVTAGASGLFGSVIALATSATSPTTTTITTGGGLFQFNQASCPTGLFGGPVTTGTDSTRTASATPPKDISSLFSGSAFGLGSPTPTTQNSVQNAFGRPTGSPLVFGVGQNPYMYSITNHSRTDGLFGTATPQSGSSLFGAPAFGVATSSTAATTTASSLFGPATGSGLFGSAQLSPSSPPSVGAFGARPVFGQSAFGSSGQTALGGATAFGSAGLFGAAAVINPSSVNPPGTLFGANTGAAATVGGGLFAALAAKSESPSFGNLAMGSPPAAAAPASPFASVASNQEGSSQTGVENAAWSPTVKDIAFSRRRSQRKSTSSRSSNSDATPEPPFSPTDPPATFYSRAKEYWANVSPTIDGMLGGYSSLNVPDIEDSHAFLDDYGPNTTAYALDCGSGIGRVTKQLLLPRFNSVDMAELTQAFLDQSEAYIGAEDFTRVGERFCTGLQDFIPPRGRYDLVWIQWVLGHLSDVALVGFLQRCAQALSNNGIIVVKENVTSPDPTNPDAGESEANFDDIDSSFTRSRTAFIAIFEKADLIVIGERLQTNFPKSIYPVRMFALRTRTPSSPITSK